MRSEGEAHATSCKAMRHLAVPGTDVLVKGLREKVLPKSHGSHFAEVFGLHESNFPQRPE